MLNESQDGIRAGSVWINRANNRLGAYTGRQAGDSMVWRTAFIFAPCAPEPTLFAVSSVIYCVNERDY